MELTKEQIKYIDNQIANYGVDYWDVRIELVDHTVSYVEVNLKNQEEFKKVVHKAFVNLGWKGTFSHLNTQGWKNTNKFYRKIYVNGFLDFFKNLKNLILFIILFLVYYSISEFTSISVFVKFSYILFFIPGLLFFWKSYVVWRKKIGNSVHKLYGLHYIICTLLIFQIIMVSLGKSSLFSIPVEYHKLVLFTLMPIHLVFSYSGYQVYKIAIKKVENMKNKMIS
ncbi:hypothetical protein [Polaribacter aestuariivivens]|uniref:hypothetical protein n=1 Tax=Polaribacter aestuariivivens TaxID=2304626 RepID=UPI003F499011